MANKSIDYNKLRDAISAYHRFTFRKRKNENYTPQQKSSITRTYNRLSEYAEQVEKNRASFIKAKRSQVRNIDGVKTNKGIFYKYPGAKLSKVKTGKGKQKKYVIKTRYKQRREIFFPFPFNILHDIDLIMLYVAKLVRLYNPDYILWSVNGFRGGTPYIPQQFFHYGDFRKDPEGKIAEALAKDNGGFYNGVFFGWFPESVIRGF